MPLLALRDAVGGASDGDSLFNGKMGGLVMDDLGELLPESWNDPVCGDGLALLTEVRTSSVSGACWKESSIVRDDLPCYDSKLMGDLDESLKDCHVSLHADAIVHVGEVITARDVIRGDAGESAQGGSLRCRSKVLAEVLDGLKLINVAANLQEDEGSGVIAVASPVGVERSKSLSNPRKIKHSSYQALVSTMNKPIRLFSFQLSAISDQLITERLTAES